MAHESFDGALTVKALGREDFETERFSLAAHRLRDKVITVERAAATYRSVVESFPAVTTVLVLTIGTMRIAAGAITPGELVSVAYLLSLISVPMRLIGYVLWDLAESLAGWRRVREVLDADELVEHGQLHAVEDESGARVGGEDIGFGYDEGDTVISELELDVPPGKVVAMVGRTASGKSTLAVLLARLWDPSTGTIHLDGRDLRSFARSELAREVAFVSQETFLFDDTVRGNITLGLTIPDDEVQGSRPSRRCRRVHQPVARGLRHPDRGAWHVAVRRPAATAGAGPCPGAPSPPSHPRRRHLVRWTPRSSPRSCADCATPGCRPPSSWSPTGARASCWPTR